MSTAAFTNQAKKDALSLIVPAASTIKMALYTTSATLSATTDNYSATNEVTNGAGTAYTAAGATVTHATMPSVSGTTAIWCPTASVSWGPALTIPSSGQFDTALLYDVSRTGAGSVSNPSLAVFTFGSQSVSNGTFSLTMPTLDASNALLRIA